MPNEPSVEESVARLERRFSSKTFAPDIHALIADWRARGDAMDAAEALALKFKLELDALRADWRKRGEARDMLEKELDALSASHKDLAHRVARMGEALKEIAQQKLIEEYAVEADPNTGDWDGAYDACVSRPLRPRAQAEEGRHGMSEFDPALLDRGQSGWASSEDDSGPDVGHFIGLGNRSWLWIGEIPEAEYNELSDDHKALGDSGSWWVVMHTGDGQKLTLGKAVAGYGGNTSEFIDRLCVALAPKP